VTVDQMASGKSVVTAIEAKRARKAKAIAHQKRTPAVRVAARAPVQPKAPREVQPVASVPSPKPGRLGLAELKAAALARREGPMVDPVVILVAPVGRGRFRAYGGLPDRG
jgi:hypothetical protein